LQAFDILGYHTSRPKEHIVRFLRCCLPVSLLIAFGIGISTAGASVTLLSMNTDPIASGWTVQQGNPSGSHSVAGGLLTINSPSFYEMVAPEAAWFASVDNAAGWVVETRMRYLSGGNPVNVVLWVHDRTFLTQLEIRADSLVLFRGTNQGFMSVPIGPTDTFRTYRIEAQGPEIDVFVDDQQVIDFTRTAASNGTQTFFFGDGYFSHASVTQWDYMRIQTGIPEPVATSLAALALAFGRRRRCDLASDAKRWIGVSPVTPFTSPSRGWRRSRK
jgi:hypothetical protein